jgi:hypothetical protein
VELRTVEGEDVTSGVESERMIVGVFCGNDSMDMYHIDDLDYSCREELCRISENFIKKIAASVGPDPTVKTIKPFD